MKLKTSAKKKGESEIIEFSADDFAILVRQKINDALAGKKEFALEMSDFMSIRQ